MNSRTTHASIAILFFLCFFTKSSFSQSLVFKTEISGYEKGFIQFAGWKSLDSNSNGLLAIVDSEYNYVYIVNEANELVHRFRPKLDYPTQLIAGFAMDNSDRVIVGLADKEGFKIYDSAGNILKTVTSGYHYSIDTDEAGNIYTLGNSGVSVYDNNGIFKKSFADPSQFGSDPSFEVSNGKIFVCDKSAVTIFSTDGIFLFKFDHLGSVNTSGKITVQQDGTIYVASYWNKIGTYSPEGVFIEEFTPYTPEGEFPAIADITFNSEGKLFLSRTSSTIQVFNQDRTFLTQFGTDYIKSQQILHFPSSFDFDTNGNITSINGVGQSIKIFNADRSVQSTMKTLETSHPMLNTFMPSLTVDKNNRIIVFSHDEGSDNKIKIMSSSGEIIKELVEPDSPFSFSRGACVATDSENNIYVYDLGSVTVFNEDGDYLRRFNSNSTDVLPELNEFPFFLQTSSIYIDENNNVFLFKPNREYVYMSDVEGNMLRAFYAPYAVAVTADPERELVYIATNSSLVIFDYDGNYIYEVTEFGSTPEIGLISDMAVDPATHHLIVSDFFHQRLVEFQFLNKQEINFASLPYGEFIEDTFTLVASSSSGLPVSFVSANPEIASIEGNIVTLHGIGTTEITAMQEGNAHFLAAAPVTQTLNVDLIMATEKNPSITFPYPNPTQGMVSIPALTKGDEVLIMNMKGESKRLEVLESNTVDLTSYPGGMYLIQIRKGNRSTTMKVLKK
jgi:hypothetical protein